MRISYFDEKRIRDYLYINFLRVTSISMSVTHPSDIINLGTLHYSCPLKK